LYDRPKEKGGKEKGDLVCLFMQPFYGERKRRGLPGSNARDQGKGGCTKKEKGGENASTSPKMKKSKEEEKNVYGFQKEGEGNDTALGRREPFFKIILRR